MARCGALKLFVIISLSLWIIISCSISDEEKPDAGEVRPQPEINLTGEQLSRKYCQSCHKFPDPSTLDRATWERSVLPLMGRLFGIYEDNAGRNEVIEGAVDRELVRKRNIFPDRQLISDDEWRKINEYYLSEAPESLPSIEREYPLLSLEGFETIVPSSGNDLSRVTMIKAKPEDFRIYIGGDHGDRGVLNILNMEFDIIQTIPVPTAPTDITVRDNYLTVTLIGSLRLAPSGNAFGELLHILRNPGEETYSSFSRFADELNRPVQTVVEDISGNGYEDMLIAEFGYYTGSLTLYEHGGADAGSYRKITLKDAPGAVRTYVKDMNGNGHKDIIALFAQGDEGISIFYNDGEGNYNEERVLTFNPSYGSVYFEIVDFNNNGYPDLIYCNGDNADYPPILKDYHGIRIFENDGYNSFTEAYFFPMYGAYKCSAADFNHNGLPDIVAVSFFPDEDADSREDFIYLKNLGNYSFSPKTLGTEIPGRWITFDITDIDGNGYRDIILGAHGEFNGNSHRSVQPGVESSSILILKNLGMEGR